MKYVTCIICPNGCRMSVADAAVMDGGETCDAAGCGSLQIRGNLCKRGEVFALQEIRDPRRSVTTTCRTAFAQFPTAPVRTSGEVRKDLMQAIVAEVNKVTIDRPMKIGDVVIRDVLGTGVDIVLCTDRLEEIQCVAQM